MNKLQRGNTLLIALILVVIIGAGGYYIYNSSLLDSSNLQSGYVLATLSPQATSGPVSTSEELTLTITSPMSGAELTNKNITITGKTSPNADVFVNDAETKADIKGNFSLKIILDEGINELIVSANDTDGNVVEQTLSVNVQTF